MLSLKLALDLMWRSFKFVRSQICHFPSMAPGVFVTFFSPKGKAFVYLLIDLIFLLHVFLLPVLLPVLLSSTFPHPSPPVTF